MTAKTNKAICIYLQLRAPISKTKQSRQEHFGLLWWQIRSLTSKCFKSNTSRVDDVKFERHAGGRPRRFVCAPLPLILKPAYRKSS